MHKKILAVLAVMSSLVLPQNRANDIEPTKEFYTAIHRGSTPVTIDGNLTEWTGVPVLSDPKFAIPKGSAATGTYVLFEPYNGGTWTGPDDQTSAVEIVWDADNVYFGFIVTDDYHENSAFSAWNGDSVQLMIANATRTAQIALYNYALGGTEDALDDPANTIVMHEAGPGGTTAIVRRDTAAKKTYYEIQLPASSLGLTAPLTAGTKFGLGMAINDGDDGAGQNGQKGWGGLGAHAIVFGKTPSETALVTLSDQLPGTDVIFLSSINPQINQFTFRVSDKGTSISDPTTAKLLINGTAVTLTSTPKSGGAVDFTYTPTVPFAPNSKNTYAIEVKDTNGQIASDSGNFTTPQYGLLTSADKVTADTTKRGFIWKIHQNGKNTTDSYYRAINQLAGLLGANHADPNAQSIALAPATPNTAANTNQPLTFEIATFINMNIDPAGDPQGNIQPDDQMVGLPGEDVNGDGTGINDGIAADVITYVELTKGFHTLIVNSDDGFRTFVGPVNDVFKRVLAGSFDGGRGAADSPFQVYAPEDGVYPMRTIYEQGGGGGNIEILEQKADGTKFLLNDDANGVSKTYRSATGADVGGNTAITSVIPAPGATGVNGGGAQSVEITEGTDAVTLSSIVLKVDGNTVTATPTKSGNVITVSYTPATPLQAGAMHTNQITFTAGTTSRSETWSYKASLLGPGTLFIEAEDFNFGHGQYDTTNPIGMNGVYAGGTYQDLGDGLGGADCDGTDFGIDYHDNNNTSDQAIYRPNTPVEAGKRNGPAGLDRGTFSVQINHNLGWTDASEWMNYTRDFPTTGTTTYNVYARMAHGDSTQRRGGILSTVQGDTTLCANGNQTTTELGRFSAPWTGGWDTWPDAGTDQDALIQMKDAAGGPALVKLSGHLTLRFQYNEGAGDFDYLAFIPVAGVIPPKVTSLSPTPNATGLSASPAFNATILNQDLKFTGATLKLDDVAVSPTVNVTATGGTVSFAPTTPFAPGSSHSYTFTYTDDQNFTHTSVIPFSVSFHPFPNGTLFIEAEDFNFGHGQYDTVNAIGMTGPYNGGTYQDKGDGLNGADCDGTDFGIDYHDNNGTSDQAVYRPNTPVEAGKRNGPAGLNRQLFNVQINHNLGWTDASEWMNYTRDFPAGDHFYKVMARMAHGDANSRRGGILSRVTGDPTQCADPTTDEQLGTFSAPWTGGWDTWPDAGTDQDALIPMLDASGAEATIKLNGHTTLRFQYNEQAGDFDYLAFLPQTIAGLEPLVTSLTPADKSSGASVSGTFTATIDDRDFTVSSVALQFDGATVTPTVTKSGKTTTVTFTPGTALAPGSSHTYSLTVTSNSGNPAIVANSAFKVTYTPLPAGTLFIEAEDFNFGKGGTITGTPIGMTGAYPGGSFQDKGDGLNGAACDGSDFGVDYNDNNATSDAAVYRPNTPVEAGKRNGPAGFNRGAFNVQVNHVVGWTDSSEWMNYTRDFPATPQAYKVYARMAHGDGTAGVLRGGTLFQVTGDPTQCDSSGAQTTTQLGSFSAPWTGGWDTWPDAGTTQDALIPMTDANGAPTTVTLGGKTTLRFQYANNAGDFDYLAFVPAGTVNPPPNLKSVTVNANGSITVTWDGGGTLQTTPALTPNPTWTDVTGATSPFTFTPQAGTPILFGRIKQ
jgi:hypothetical protein